LTTVNEDDVLLMVSGDDVLLMVNGDDVLLMVNGDDLLMKYNKARVCACILLFAYFCFVSKLFPY
jgi:hypothetical protein